ncbi:hypothetical protein [Leeuwenhoekiella sp. H156]|uniref:hypothetical protein n=1 Tax=Leeuwenhoekiella sp. H156 TaxID=3450128 RepID=UPI003FA41D03
MKNVGLLLVTALLLGACGGVRKSEKDLARGNYDQVIIQMLDNLRVNKSAERKEPYIALLKDAFVKAVDRDERRLDFLEKEGNPNTLRERYALVTGLSLRQDRIRPILPLPGTKFSFTDYSDAIISIKNDLSKQLIESSTQLLENGTKADARLAYDDLAYLEEINPGYANTAALLEDARYKGTTFVRLALVNETEMAIPARLENDLLNIDTYKLNRPWVQYHNREIENLAYDYDLILSFRGIQISPELVTERILKQEKKVKDGFDYVLDKNGNVKKDSLGNDIKVDKFKTLRADIHEFTQSKNTQITAQVDLIDLNTSQLEATFPLNDGFIFNHIYATYTGDKEAIDPKMLTLLGNRPVPFPTNEQMVYDSGESLKLLFKDILVNEIRVQ